MNVQRKTAVKQIIVLCVAFLFTAGAFGFFGMETFYGTLPYFLASFAMYQLICRAEKNCDRKCKWPSFLFSVLLTASFAVGHQVNTEQAPYFPDMTPMDWAYLLPFAGMVYVCVLNLMDWILSHEIPNEKTESIVGWEYWAKVFLANIIFWLPYFLVFYPGNLSWDSVTSVEQIMGTQPWSNWHPVMFTASIGIFMNAGMLLGDINFGIACYTFAQMTVFAGILSYTVFWMKKKGVPDVLLLLVMGFYFLNPVIATYAVTLWKDILFSGFMLLLVLFLFDVAQGEGQLLGTGKGIIRLAVLFFLVAFWRNNGIYILIVVTAVLAVCYRKYCRQFLLPILTVLALILFIQGPVYEKIGIDSGYFSEAAGILLQQIAYTMEQDGIIDAKSLEFLDQILPVQKWAVVYSPGGADSIKFDPEFNNQFLNENAGEFIRVWLKLLPQNFARYVKAWLMNTLGYFHIGTTSSAVWYGIIPLEQAEMLGIFRTDLLAAVMHTDIIASVIEAFLFFMYDLPVFNVIYSIAASVWAVFLCGIILIRRKKWWCLLSVLPLVALWGTLMIAAPVNCGFRYMFSFHLAMPVVLMMICVTLLQKDTNN